MTSRIISVAPFDLVVFGGTGDLAYRKLFPSMYLRDRDRQFTEPTRIIGVSRKPLTDGDYRQLVREALNRYLPPGDLAPAEVERFIERIRYVAVDIGGEAGWSDLAALFAVDGRAIRAFYLATAPELFGVVAQRLAAHGLVNDQARIVVEKPLGKDLASAAAINDAIGAVFSEARIFRIDHYLGKETVQNLMALRFANVLFEPLWNAAHIDHVQITVAESIGVEGRGDYYDRSGALRDMVQNHLLQLLCLVAMEPPSSMTADAVRDEKLKVLKALAPIGEDEVATHTVRGQYRAGATDGVAVPGYLDEITNPTSDTETFVAIRAQVQNWRWARVPFYLRTGKRLASRLSEIVIAFRPVPHSIFGPAPGQIVANRLVIRLQPNEGIKLWVMIKEPGPGGMRLQHVPLDMSFAQAFERGFPDAYERLLMDVVRGNPTLFMRRDEVEAAWHWIDPIRDAWSRRDGSIRPYMAGTWGPTAAIAMIERDGRTWNEDWM